MKAALVMAVTEIDALSGPESGSKNACPSTSWPGHSFCGFCAHDKISERSSAPVLEGQPIFETVEIQQYGRRDNVRIVGLDEVGSIKNPYKEVIKMTSYCRVSL